MNNKYDISILRSLKKALKIPEDYDAFDSDILLHINSYIGVIKALGVGVDNFRVTGYDETWSDFLTDKYVIKLAGVQTWMLIKLRLIFDPPANSFVTNELESLCKEQEFHIYAIGEMIRKENPEYWGDTV